MVLCNSLSVAPGFLWQCYKYKFGNDKTQTKQDIGKEKKNTIPFNMYDQNIYIKNNCFDCVIFSNCLIIEVSRKVK